MQFTWIRALPHLFADDARQRSALVRTVRFFAAMLVLTLVARGASGASLPVVITAVPSRGTVVQSVTAQGSLAAQPGGVLTAPEGLTVSRVLVQVGQTVAEGDAVAELDEDSVSRALDEAKAEAAQLSAQLSELTATSAPDSGSVNAARLARDQAQENYNAADSSTAQEVAAAQSELDALQSELDSMKADPATTPEALTQQQGLVDAARTALETAQKTRDDTLRSLRQALDSANLSCSQAESAYAAASESARRTAQSNEAEAKSVRLSLETANERVAELEDILNAGCILKADAAGSVRTLDLTPGTETPSAIAQLTDASAGFVLTAALTEEQAEQLAEGSALTVRQEEKEGKATVASLEKSESGVQLTAYLPADGWKTGAVSISAELSSTTYDMTLPSSALYEDNSGPFVYVIEERSTVLGLQYVLVRTPVTCLENNGTTAAVSGVFAPSAKVVVSATRILQEGARVRLA